MDESRKAASVAQLKELHDAVMPRLDALEAEDKTESDPMQGALVQALATRLLTLEQKLEQYDAKCDQMMAKMDAPDAPVDLTPLIALITKMGEQQMEAIKGLAALAARPVTRTGEAVLPDGGKVTLKVSEARM